MEIYKKHRPGSFKDVIGQNNVVKILETKIKKNKLPHSILLIGDSGCGKTTLGRIIRKELGCKKSGFREINGADQGGVDDMRRIRSNMSKAPMKGKCKVWLIDEAHKVSEAGQQCLLKMLEDTPRHVYFILATTDPQKLKKAIRTRCMEVKVNKINDTDMTNLLLDIGKKEKIKKNKKVIAKIVKAADGSARKALVFLDKIMDLDSTEEMIEAIESATVEVQAIAIVRALINKGTTWPAMCKILKETSKEDPESMRWMILGYAKSCLLGANSNIHARAFNIIDEFQDNFYDSKHAGLVAACYDIIKGCN